MAYSAIMDSIPDECPDAIKDLYTERDGKFHLTGISGLKTQADIDRQQAGLEQERENHKKTKERLAAWGDLDHSDVMAKLDRIPELEVLAKGNKDEFEAKLEDLVEARITSRTAPIDRENKTLKSNLETALGELNALKSEKTMRKIQDSVMAEAVKNKVVATAFDDVNMLAGAVFEEAENGAILTKENPYGITPGLSPDVFIQEMQEKKPHWWPVSSGGDSKGSSTIPGMTKNPFSADHWNLTEQGKVIKEHGMEKAGQLAKSAGTTVGGSKPQPKTA